MVKRQNEIAAFNGAAAMRLRDGEVTIFDAVAVPTIADYFWVALPTVTGRTYAISYSFGRMTYLHRLILPPEGDLVTDHINNHGLDNRLCNLRRATLAENAANTPGKRERAGKPCSSQFKGVSWSAARQTWVAQIKSKETYGKGRTRYLGRFKNETDAARAYDRVARELWGPFAHTNFKDEA